MKTICVLMLCFLAGCAGRTTLEELKDDAFVTGNWSKVEERERLLQKQGRKSGPECPNHQTVVCFESGLTVRCQCMQPQSMGRIGASP